MDRSFPGTCVASMRRVGTTTELRAGGNDASRADADAIETDAGTAAGWRRRRDPLVLVAAALVLVPAIAAAISALRNPWAPTADWALIELQVRDVGTADTPLLGAWSRYGWRHPGPWPFYLLALPYRLVPDDRGLLFAASCLNLAAAAGYALVVVRYRRIQALIALLGLAVLQRGLGVDQLSDPWNPTILIVPFALYLVLCLEIAVGRSRWPIPVVVGVGSFIVQAHVGVLQPVLLVGVVAGALRWHRRRREAQVVVDVGPVDDADEAAAPARTSAWTRWRPLLPTAAVIVAAWLPPLLDQVSRTGNLGLLLRWAAGDDLGAGMGPLTEGRMGADRLVDSTAWLLDPFGLWIGHFRIPVVFGSPLLGTGDPLQLLWVPVALVAAVTLVRRVPVPPSYLRRTSAAAVLAATGVVALVSDLASAKGAPVVWPFRWAVAVVMLLWITAAWAVAALASHRLPWLDGAPAQTGVSATRTRAALVGGVMVALVALPVGLAVGRGTVGRQPAPEASAALLRLAPAIEEHAGREELVVANTEWMLNDKDLGLPVLLERAGIPWVERSDPRADGYDGYYIVPVGLLENDQLVADLATGSAEVLARSGPPQGDEDPGGELVFLRIAPQAGLAYDPSKLGALGRQRTGTP